MGRERDDDRDRERDREGELRKRPPKFQGGEIELNERDRGEHEEEFIPISLRDNFPPASLPGWPGPELAMEVIRTQFHQIGHALQPQRLDVISRSVREGLHMLHMLEEFWEGQPPGAFRRTYNPHPPFGGVRNTGETR